MSYGIVNADYYNGTTISLNPEDIGFNYNHQFFENSKKGLKDLVKFVFDNGYPSLTMTKRTFLSNEENEKMKERYHNALSRVVWSDYPDLRGVPDYHENLKAYDSSRTFDKLWIEKKVKKYWSNDLKVNTEVKRDIADLIKDLEKHVIIHSVELIRTHYVSCNENFARITFSEVSDISAILKLREEKEIAEKKAEEAKKVAEEAKRLEEEAAMNEAIKIIDTTYYGKYMKAQNKKYSSSVISDIMNGNISPKFLDVVNPEELLNADTAKSKDFQRIIGILEKANTKPYNINEPLVLKINEWKACNLARNMNVKIKNEEKRVNRKNAAIELGVKYIANCFC